jgi:hypothetical protein
MAVVAFHDVAPVEDPGAPFDVVREKNLERPELEGVQYPSDERSDWDSSPARVLGVDVLVAGGIVKLWLSCAHEDVLVCQLAKVDLRTGQLDRDRRDRRQILDEEYREAFARYLVHGRHRHAHSVRESQPLIYERPGRQRGGVQLSRGQVNLSVFAIDSVAVVID